MYESMYICVCMSLCICVESMYMCLYQCTGTSACMCVYVCMTAHTSVCLCMYRFSFLKIIVLFFFINE